MKEKWIKTLTERIAELREIKKEPTRWNHTSETNLELNIYLLNILIKIQ